ncbi:MAG: superoxide dismutase [Deinococcus sp.]|nr:superoxide dismutase [Deinococcus sp.]MCL5964698.1 superoxide dismutase [Deinococcus sp.]
MSYPFKLPDLGYPKDALEPNIDSMTMEIHHGKHHNAYVTNLNAALEKAPELQSWSLEDLLKKISQVPEAIRTAVRNNGGGHHNHTFLWEILTPGGSKTPTGRLADAINSTFGSFDKLKEMMTQAGMTRFGSGWSWLVKDAQGKLQVYSTANQDSPLMEGHTPLLGIDVWEHAYYLKYQNRRNEYLANIWNVVNWDKVSSGF